MNYYKIGITTLVLLSGVCTTASFSQPEAMKTLAIKGKEARKAYEVWDKAFEGASHENSNMMEVLATMYYALPTRTKTERNARDVREEQFKNKFGLEIRDVGLPIEMKGFRPIVDVILRVILPKTQELASKAEELKNMKQHDPHVRAIVEKMYSFLLYILLGYDYPGVDRQRLEKAQKSVIALEEILGPERVIALRKKVGQSIQSPSNIMKAWYELMSKPDAKESWCIPSVDFCLGEPFSTWDTLVNVGIFVLAGTALLYGRRLAAKKAAHAGGV